MYVPSAYTSFPMINIARTREFDIPPSPTCIDSDEFDRKTNYRVICLSKQGYIYIYKLWKHSR